MARHIAVTGDASCYWFSPDNLCEGCGVFNERRGECTNTCTPPIVCDDLSRRRLAGFSGSEACLRFNNRIPCEATWHIGISGAASCYWTGSECEGCGAANEKDGLCTNTCKAPPTCADPTRTVFAGGPQGTVCRSITSQASCEMAWHRTRISTAASCFWTGTNCQGCGPFSSGACTNTCEP